MSRPLTRALTIKQPWAHLVARGDKPIENRSWVPPEFLYGERFAIHAGKGWDRDCPHEIHRSRVTFGAIIAVASVSCIVRSEADAEMMMPGEGHWFIGPVGWILSNVIPVTPIPCNGRLGLWKLSFGLKQAIESSLRKSLVSPPQTTAGVLATRNPNDCL